MLKVYYTDTADQNRDPSRFPLSDYRVEKLRTVKASLLRNQMISAELLLNRAVKDWNPEQVFPLPIAKESNGKPVFMGLPLCFSLSHSGRYAACAISDYIVGLDIQERAAVRNALVHRSFSEKERHYLLRAQDTDLAFTKIWSLKESYSKALGTGLLTPFSDFSLDFSNELCLAGLPDVRFWNRGDRDFQLSLCVLDGNNPEPDVVIKTELGPE